ncbi:MAG: Phosphoglycerate mutase [Acidimicrobiales bacterium]|jgi:broad specificity phosphatase PhoE|nr:Phosphoglycerate mutase [Acidimicrobiales bacterium]
MAGRALLLRHGQSTWNADGRWQGWADPPLSAAGREQAAAAAVLLAAAGETFPGGVVSSDLARARETADIIAAAMSLGEVGLDPALRERDVGAWSGLTTAEIERRWPGWLDAWRRGELPSPPDGEADTQFVTRALAAVEHHAADATGDVLLVAHGGLIRAVERALTAEPSRPGNLCGRWLTWDGSALHAGAACNLSDDHSSTTRL